ncbi:MAG: ABC transporter permease [Parasporobacterium sp.]|nr:ABC transporter permease [Parasporobacterium sp.]
MSRRRINDAAIAALKRQSNFADIWRRLKKNKLAMVGLVIVCILVIACVFANLIAPYDYAAQDYSARLQFPSWQHLCGTDNFGRDIFSRILYGGRISLLVSLMSCVISLVFGGLLGIVSGYAGGKTDNIIMRLCDLLMAIPATLLAIVISATLGGGVFQTAIAISIGGIAPTARLVRATALTIRGQQYIEAARAAGSSQFHIIMTHAVPNCLAPIIVDMSLRIGGNIMMISAMSFIGLGVQPPTPEWGQILNSGREFIRNFWPLCTFPGLAIMLTMFGFNVLGDGLRDALDPKLKQ